MKTEKDKAIEITNSFKDFVNPYMGSGMLSNTYDDDAILWQSKKCALVAVDQIIESLQVVTGHLRLNNSDRIELSKDFDFWNRVKEEIGLL